MATDLYEGAATLTSKYVNVSGPDSVYAVSGTAFLGKVAGSMTSPVTGVKGYGENTSSGEALGGYFYATSSGTGQPAGVKGEGRSSSSAITYGAVGTADNSSTGAVYGGFFRTYASGTGDRYGVYGLATSYLSATTVGCYAYAQNTTSGTTYAGRFVTTPAGTGVHYGVYAEEVTGGSGAAIYAAGDFVASGTKSAVLRTTKGPRLMSVLESPEVWFEDFGEGQLVNGKAHIELDPMFLETVTINNSNPMKVFVQLEGDCNGVYVAKGTTGFDVNELRGGTSNTAFSYRVVAKRRGYETERMRATDIGKEDPNLYPELKAEIEKKHQEEQAQQ